MNFWENAGGRDPRNGCAGGAQNDGCRGQACGGASMEDKLSSYLGKSEEQLMSELSSAVDKMKADGTFDPSALERVYNAAYPFLSDAQRERMRAIIDMLKR